MAPAQSSNRQPGTPHEPIHLECFEGVGRTGRDVTAGRNPTGEQPLIAAHTPCRQTRRKRRAILGVSCARQIVVLPTDRAHWVLPTSRSRQLSTSAKRTERSTSAAPGCRAKSQQPEGKSGLFAARSSPRWARTCLRRRLRTTAVPTLRETANATRGGSLTDTDDANMVTATVPLRTRRPRRRSSSNERRSRIRQIRPTAVCGP